MALHASSVTGPAPKLCNPDARTRVLALEPFYGGSHRAFLDGWSQRSALSWTMIGLPNRHWKWRMRHAALTMAEQAGAALSRGEQWDVLWCSDMLNLAEFRGLVNSRVARLPAVAYFHENQLTYPVREHDERDYHFAFTNLMTAIAADQVWFNSEFHRGEFLAALEQFLRRMPDYPLSACADRIAAKSQVRFPGVDHSAPRSPRREGPLRILWTARWEHDKNPEDFFAALELLEQQHVDFRISVIGESFQETPEVFKTARCRWASRIDRWGFQPTRAEYLSALLDADVFVSTARHEFFGIAAVEAMTAGAYPLLPRRLSYPELLNSPNTPSMAPFFYDGTARDLAGRLSDAARLVRDRERWQAVVQPVLNAVKRYRWEGLVGEMDHGLRQLAEANPSRGDAEC